MASIIQKIKSLYYKRTGTLFDGEDALFKEFSSSCTVYGEYGVGASTRWVLNHTNLPIISVDTSKEWVSKTLTSASRRNGVIISYIDVGDVGNWGRPITFEKRLNFKFYTNYLWDHSVAPDLVLIDGRFRVACFINTILKARPETKILFDDYLPRKNYHVVEEYLRPIEVRGRQAVFIVPINLDKNYLKNELEKFLYVVD